MPPPVGPGKVQILGALPHKDVDPELLEEYRNRLQQRKEAYQLWFEQRQIEIAFQLVCEQLFIESESRPEFTVADIETGLARSKRLDHQKIKHVVQRIRELSEKYTV